MKREQKTLTNKGFSLVELIIVVAIMAVLIGVLAPQYLRYVEKTRLQRDNSSIAEVANVIKMASADENVITQLAGGAVTYNFSATGMTGGGLGGTLTALDNEITATITPADVKITSNTYSSAAPVLTVKINSVNNQIEVEASGWMDTPNSPAGGTTKKF